MKKDIFRYIFSIIILFCSIGTFAQNDSSLYVQPKEKEPLKLLGIKFGVNIGRFADFQFKPERSSYEGSFDINFSNNIFGVIEAGHSEIDLQKTTYNYQSSGDFIKIGIDHNMLKKHPTDYLGIGFRIGWAEFSQSADHIAITDDHWGTYTTSVAPKTFNAYWLQVNFGIKGELLKNVYLGWSAMVNIHIKGGKDFYLQPYDIPGFGKGTNSINLGANYYIYYQIPFKRK